MCRWNRMLDGSQLSQSQLWQDWSDLVLFLSEFEKYSGYSVRVLEGNIFPSKSLKNSGISMDRDLTMSTQISKTIQMCFTSLRRIRSFKGCLTMNSLKSIASALVLSRIDYGNMALISLPKVTMQSIQSIINTTARLITWVKNMSTLTLYSKRFIS